MEGKLLQALVGFLVGAVVDAALTDLGMPKHTAKVVGAIAGALL